MSTKVFTVSELLEKLKDISFSDLKKQKSGYVSWINIKDSGKLKRLYVKTPKMFAPFGATNYKTGDASSNKKFSVALSFKGEETNEEIAKLKKLLETLDDLVVENTLKNKEWKSQISKKTLTKELVETNYTYVVREGNQDGDKKYPGLFNLKAQVNWKDNEATVGTKVYDNTKKELNITFDNFEQVIPKLTDMKCVFQIASVWFINKKFGLTLKLIQAKIFTNELGTINEFVIDDEEEEVTNNLKQMKIEDKKVEVKKETEEEESEDEDEEEESDKE